MNVTVSGARSKVQSLTTMPGRLPVSDAVELPVREAGIASGPLRCGGHGRRKRAAGNGPMAGYLRVK
jgi:hypothetical protein